MAASGALVTRIAAPFLTSQSQSTELTAAAQHHDWHKYGRLLGRQRQSAIPRRFAPDKQMLSTHLMPARHLRHDRAGRVRNDRPLSASLHRRRRPTPLRISTRPRGAEATTIRSTIYANQIPPRRFASSKLRHSQQDGAKTPLTENRRTHSLAKSITCSDQIAATNHGFRIFYGRLHPTSARQSDYPGASPCQAHTGIQKDAKSVVSISQQIQMAGAKKRPKGSRLVAEIGRPSTNCRNA